MAFADISGTIADSQIPAGIARDTELPTAGTGITANGTAFNIDVPVPAFADAMTGYVLKIVENAGTKSLEWAADATGTAADGNDFVTGGIVLVRHDNAHYSQSDLRKHNGYPAG